MIKNFELVKLLIEKNLTISFAESITGGLLAKYITDCPGSSKIFKESYITYENDIKTKVLHVDSEIINKYGVVSKEVAIEMAKGLKSLTNSNINISTTGNAGPKVCDDKRVGLAYYAINLNDKIYDYELDLSTNVNNLEAKNDIEIRHYIREEIAKTIFNKLIDLVNNI